MGQLNSSLTRVQPALGAAFDRDRTGASWLPGLLSASDRAARIPAEIRADPGTITEFAFERAVEPPTAFLRWLLEHPDRLSWPTVAGTRREFGTTTTAFRRRLIDAARTPDGQQAKRDALAALQESGAAGSRGKWWAFEGFTHVDVFIATAKVVLLVEGKRTEALSASTDWYPARNQLARNLEAAGAVAGDRLGLVVLALEKPIPNLDTESLRASLPHLDRHAQDIVISRFAGQGTWSTICAAIGIDYASLPRTVAEAVDPADSLG